MHKTTPFHEGELAIQERTGDRAAAARLGGMLAGSIMPRALPFLEEQRTVAAATLDREGRLWASLWVGEPGFVTSRDGTGLSVSRALLDSDAGDPVLAELREQGPIGLLAIDLGTRRRLRVNGVVAALDAETVEVEVRESFPNCPKYIQRRVPHPTARLPEPIAPVRGTALDGPRRALLASTDTLFVASLHPERGLDVSHRGGAPGFVRILGDQTLRLPDYPGNGLFQTLGNFAVDDRAGMVAVDFAGGRLLSLGGRARLRFDEEDPTHPTGGTGRYWELTVERWVEHGLPASDRWELLDAWAGNPPAGRAR